MKLGDYIRDYRKQKGISQRQFAAMCGVSNGYISMLEEGKNPRTNEPIVPSLQTLKKICAVIGISIHDLISVVDDMPITMKAEQSSVTSDETKLSDHEKAVITAYRNHPEMQCAVDKLLGVEREGTDITKDMIETVRAGVQAGKNPTGVK